MTSDFKPTWRKNLYSNNGYSDNYTDVTFLASLKTNINQKDTSVPEAVLGAGSVTEKLCMVFVFFAIYQIIANEFYPTSSVFLASSIASGLCYLAYLRTQQGRMQKIYIHSRIVFLFLILGFLLSPVLKTLTETISSDTIDATAIVMMLIHLIFYDYKVPAAIASPALSLNAAIFASICLASRLRTSFDAFLLLTVSAKCFVLYPTFAYSQRKKLSFSFLLCIFLLTTLTIALSSSLKMGIFFAICTIFINLMCPFLFVYWQKHKMNIYGPWDEAIISAKTS